MLIISPVYKDIFKIVSSLKKSKQDENMQNLKNKWDGFFGGWWWINRWLVKECRYLVWVVMFEFQERKIRRSWKMDEGWYYNKNNTYNRCSWIELSSWMGNFLDIETEQDRYIGNVEKEKNMWNKKYWRISSMFFQLSWNNNFLFLIYISVREILRWVNDFV